MHEKHQKSQKQNIIFLMCNYESWEMFIFFLVLSSLSNFHISVLTAFYGKKKKKTYFNWYLVVAVNQEIFWCNYNWLECFWKIMLKWISLNDDSISTMFLSLLTYFKNITRIIQDVLILLELLDFGKNVEEEKNGYIKRFCVL